MQKRSPARRMTYREWKIRKCLRLARNWVLFLAACGGAVALMATGILWLLPKAHALIAGPVPFRHGTTTAAPMCSTPPTTGSWW